MKIISHRGLEPSNLDFWPESSYEAFQNHLSRGFGIEFDVNFCADELIVSHDSNLGVITNGKDRRDFSDVPIMELKQIRYGKKQGRIATLNEILELIKRNSPKINALHLKGKFQNKEKIDLLVNNLGQNQKALEKMMIFDVKPKFAKYIKERIPEMRLAPSISHDSDIERYNQAVLGTLISLDEAIKYRKDGLYDWVWLDEWDTLDGGGRKKLLYSKETFNRMREAGYKIALVTPELHRTSPELLGGEAHEDAKNKVSLFNRIKEIINLNPDAICTDYPREINNLVKNNIK